MPSLFRKAYSEHFDPEGDPPPQPPTYRRALSLSAASPSMHNIGYEVERTMGGGSALSGGLPDEVRHMKRERLAISPRALNIGVCTADGPLAAIVRWRVLPGDSGR
jgi:hypothetical protein